MDKPIGTPVSDYPQIGTKFKKYLVQEKSQFGR